MAFTAPNIRRDAADQIFASTSTSTIALPKRSSGPSKPRNHRLGYRADENRYKEANHDRQYAGSACRTTPGARRTPRLLHVPDAGTGPTEDALGIPAMVSRATGQSRVRRSMAFLQGWIERRDSARRERVSASA